MVPIAKDKLAIQLDEAMKLCFSVSTNVLIGTINKCFDEHYNPNEPIEKHTFNTEYINIPFLSRSASDVIFSLKQHDIEKVYHIEFQTKYDNTMALRMFQYGVHHAKERSAETQNYNDLYFPKQCIIYLEEDKRISNNETLTIHFSDAGTYAYSIPVLKLWEYSLEEMCALEMFNLLPIYVFKLRKKLAIIWKKNRKVQHNTEAELSLLAELEDVYNELMTIEKLYAEKIQALVDDRILNLDDCEKLGNSNLSLVTYLEDKYFKKDIVTEVEKMIALYDRSVAQRASALGMAKVILAALGTVIPAQEVEKYEQLFLQLPETKVVEISTKIKEIQTVEELDKYMH